MSAQQLPAPGDVIGGKYRVDALCANGGMAAIFSGQHLVLGHRIAIKVMLAEGAREEAQVERFMREAQAAARLETEHVVRVMDAGVLDDGLPFLVMELLEGRDLGACVTEAGPLECAEVVDLTLEALEGLAHVHAAGIVHRDLKPSNLFLARRPDGSRAVKLLDFGISKSLVEPQDDRVKVLTGNLVVGSPVYMSPEQVRSARSVDVRSDIWSLGVTLYELMTGTLPFDGEGVGEVLAHILEAQPPPMQSRRPEVPAGLDAVVLGCLRREREDRYQDVVALARALAPFGGPAAAARVARIEATWVNAPLLRAPTTLGSVSEIRATQVERVTRAVVPVGRPKEGSGEFALSRTFADGVPSMPPATPRAVRRIAWTAGALALLLGIGAYGGLRAAQRTSAVAVASALRDTVGDTANAPTFAGVAAAAPLSVHADIAVPANSEASSADPAAAAPSSEHLTAIAKAPQPAVTAAKHGGVGSRPSFLKSRK